MANRLGAPEVTVACEARQVSRMPLPVASSRERASRRGGAFVIVIHRNGFPPTEGALATNRYRRNLRFNPYPVIHGIPDLLLAPKIALRRLYRYMPKKELDLFEFATRDMAETGTRATKIVRRQLFETSLRGEGLYDIPDHLFSQPRSQTIPLLLMDLKTQPVTISDARLQSSIRCFTQSGTGTVRTWPPLPTRSTMAQ